MRARMVVMLVDALGWTLAGRTGGLAPGLAHRRRLETVLGFSSGALPTLFTGRRPCEHGRFLMYARARGASAAFGGLGWTRLLPGALDRSWRMRQWISRAVARRGVHGYFNLYEVPLALLPHLDLPERGDIFAPGGLPLESWWDALQRDGVRWRGWNWRSPEADNLAALERALEAGEEDVLFLYTADLDALLHREGCGGPGVRERLARYGAFLARIEENAARRGEALWLYLLSDHGMVDVTRHVDARAPLAALPYRAGRDYVPFLDSTFARFWWRDRAAREPVLEAYRALGCGRWLDDPALERAGARFADRAYGDDLFLADPGVLFAPSFMGTRPVAAMHGYDPAHPDMAALLWSNRPVPERVRHLADVRAHLEAEVAALRGVAA